MKRLLLVCTAALAFGCTAASALTCNGPSASTPGVKVVQGSGTLKTETRSTDTFTAVRLSSWASVEITQSDTPSLTVTADDNLLPFHVSKVRSGVLEIETAPNMCLKGKMPAYRISVRDLDKVELGGAGSFSISRLQGKALAVSISGSGDVRVAGAVGSLEVDISGSGKVNARDLKARQAAIEVSGAGTVEVSVSQTLEASISGAGSVLYEGSPTVSSDVTGSGSVKRRGPA